MQLRNKLLGLLFSFACVGCIWAGWTLPGQSAVMGGRPQDEKIRTLTTTGNVTVGGSITTAGITSSQPVVANNGLQVSGAAANLLSGVNITGNLGVTGTSGLTGAVTTGSTITAAGLITANGGVSGTTLTASGATTANGGLSVTGATTLAGATNVSSGGLSVAGEPVAKGRYPFKAATTARTSSITVTADPDLTATLAVGTYSLDCFLNFAGATTGTQGFQFSQTFGGTATGSWVAQGFVNAAAVNSTVQTTLTAVLQYATISTSATGDYLRVYGTIKVTAVTTGIWALTWSQVASNANATQVFLNSRCAVERIA